MTDFAIGEVVKLNSGGHEMTVQEIRENDVECIWSDGKIIKSASFNSKLLVAKIVPITGINIVIVYPDKDIAEMVAEMRRVSKAADNAGFHVEDEVAREILKRRLGPTGSGVP